MFSEGVELSRVAIKCSACGYLEQKTIKNSESKTFEQSLTGRPCPNCQAPSLTVVEKIDIIDDLAQIAETSSTDVEVISTATEEGQMLKNAFGGIAAMLRFKAQG